MIYAYAIGCLILVFMTSGTTQAVFLVGELLLLALNMIRSDLRGRS